MRSFVVCDRNRELHENEPPPSPQVRKLEQDYARHFKDNLILKPPAWYASLVGCELFLQFPFLLVASFAFLKGNHFAGVPSLNSNDLTSLQADVGGFECLALYTASTRRRLSFPSWLTSCSMISARISIQVRRELKALLL